MTPARDSSNLRRTVAKYTPDRRRWRRRVAGLAAIGGVLALYAMFAIISGVKSGMVYNLLALLFGLLTLFLPAVTTAVLLAPDSGQRRTDTSRRENAVETLKRRYATGEIDQGEFDRRLDDLIGVVDDGRDQANADSAGNRTTRDAELDSTGR